MRIFPSDDGLSFWVIAKDVTNILGYSLASNPLRMVPARHKGIRSVNTLRGLQKMICVTESGLYRLILRSDRPEAEPFMDWVTDEVLPEIRRTGQYTIPAQEQYLQNSKPALTSETETLQSWAASRPQTLRNRGQKRAEAVRKLVYRMELGERICAAIEQIAAQEGISIGTLRRWYDQASRYPPSVWTAALTPAWTGRQATFIQPIVWDCFLHWYRKMPRPKVATAWCRTQEVAATREWGRIPSVGIFRRRLKKSL